MHSPGHLGHFLSAVTADFQTRFHLLKGYSVKDNYTTHLYDPALRDLA